MWFHELAQNLRANPTKKKKAKDISDFRMSSIGFDHISRNAPVLIRTPKLKRLEPAQYWGGGPPGNSVVLNPFYSFLGGWGGDWRCFWLLHMQTKNPNKKQNRTKQNSKKQKNVYAETRIERLTTAAMFYNLVHLVESAGLSTGGTEFDSRHR